MEKVRELVEREVHVTKRSDVSIMSLKGEFDVAAHDLVSGIFESLIMQNGVYPKDRHMIIDLSETTFIDANITGFVFKCLSVAQDRGGQGIIVTGDHYIPRKIFTEIFRDFHPFSVHSDLDSAHRFLSKQ